MISVVTLVGILVALLAIRARLVLLIFNIMPVLCPCDLAPVVGVELTYRRRGTGWGR